MIIYVNNYDVGIEDLLYPQSDRGLGNAVSSPSGIWGGDPVTIEFGAF